MAAGFHFQHLLDPKAGNEGGIRKHCTINVFQRASTLNDKRYRGHVSTKPVDAQFISHYAFQSGNRSSSGEILQKTE